MYFLKTHIEKVQSLFAHFMNVELQIFMWLDSLIPWLPIANKTNTLWNNDSLKYSFGLKPRRAMYLKILLQMV